MNDQIRPRAPEAATRAAHAPTSARGPSAGYLDHARVGPLSRRAAAALAAATDLATRADPADLDRLFALSDAARASAARLLDARPHEIALAPSTSNGLFTVAAALRGPGTVLVPRGEFPANVYPWLRFAGRGGPDVRLVGPDGRRHITPDLLRRHLTPDVTALTVSAVDSLTGHVAPLADLKEILGPDRLLIVDAIQGLGAVPLAADAADALVSGGQKWLRAGWGAALLLIRDRCAERLDPGLGGWAGVTEPFAERHPAPPLPGAAAHLATNPDFPAAAAIGAAVDELLAEGGPAATGARIRATLAELLDRARRAGAEVLLNGLGDHERAGIGTFRLPGHDPVTVHRTLEAAGVITTRRDEWIRLSPHVSTPAAAADLFAEALHTVTTHGGNAPATLTQEPTCPTS
ncbi:aminotransferase class V-fold PLP-dependent enzyme [Streptomyces sp. WAC01280]|uniref:aminotransferase class V-fold PLP-dependent enzyme n=1 Tax=Streptomyces sp. WAC01280 TaxID=2487424 RepID=UPI0021AFE2AF|nr:aminotransferase class V-fold PLP-dependent enzyme [Streptomyces sp. WAC01280]